MIKFKLDKGRLFASVAFALIFSTLMSLACFDASCEEIRDNVLRLHILANSDSEADQEVKIKVRDALLKEFGTLFDGATTLNEAKALAENNIEKLEQTAQKTLAAEGYTYPVKVEVAPSDFNTRVYGDLTIPAGNYMAVRVLLGKAEGQNWWCVCFPNICMGSAAKEIDRVLDSDSKKIVKSGQKFKVKFKVVEIYEKIKTKLK